MTEVEIVAADLFRPEHARSVVELTNAYALDPIGGGQPLPAHVRDCLVAGLLSQPTAIVLLAFVEGDAVGIATCFWGFSTFVAKPLVNIHDLFVRSTLRGRGIGRMLLRAIEARARERGCVKLTLEVRERNDRARVLYASEGFSQSGLGQELGPDLSYVKRLADAISANDPG